MSDITSHFFFCTSLYRDDPFAGKTHTANTCPVKDLVHQPSILSYSVFGSFFGLLLCLISLYSLVLSLVLFHVSEVICISGLCFLVFVSYLCVLWESIMSSVYVFRFVSLALCAVVVCLCFISLSVALHVLVMSLCFVSICSHVPLLMFFVSAVWCGLSFSFPRVKFLHLSHGLSVTSCFCFFTVSSCVQCVQFYFPCVIMSNSFLLCS